MVVNFLLLTEFFSTNGIAHLATPPHTPQHNSMSERRHLHIVETGLTLLTHAFIPLTYWTYAFLTAEYLINRMPSLTINFSNLYEQIFHRQPNYLKLKVFGCLCYPWIKPYNSHKLESTSKPCVFLGYSNSQSAYFCLDPNTSRVYVSRHVKFVENVFPFNHLTPQESSTHDCNMVSSTTPSITPLTTCATRYAIICRGPLTQPCTSTNPNNTYSISYNDNPSQK